MLSVPQDVLDKFDAVLRERAVAATLHGDYRKWLRYFLDFRVKYSLPDSRSEQVRLFLEKLRAKKQSPHQQRQAAHALSLYFDMMNAATTSSQYRATLSTGQPVTGGIPLVSEASKNPATTFSKGNFSDALSKDAHVEPKALAPKASSQPGDSPLSAYSRYNEWRCLEKSGSPAWDKLIDDLAAEIKMRHYSRKTLKTYADWIRKFQAYLQNKMPDTLTADDVKSYLTFLAVNCKVAASTQNQAFNALLFLYRHILKKDFGEHKDIPRAKKSTYIPIVLSPQEIDSVVKHLSYPYNLVVKLLYGCGLRLFEGVKLRVKDFNFDAGILTVRGKGNRSRTVPIPQKIVPELTEQLEEVKKIHDEDIEAGYAGVFLEDQLEKKYPKAVKDFIWQWFFPQQSLTFVEGTREKRRYHLHESHVQEALYEAVRRAKLTKRVTSHTFRHSFATHLLQANYDIRTIQTLLGHSDVRTTMIYTHCIPSRTLKEAKSPLDFYD